MRLRRWVGIVAVSLALAGTVWVFRFAGVFLETPAQEPRPADLIVVLGGDNGGRVKHAMELWRQGLAPRILLTGLGYSPEETRPYYLHWRARFLLDRGIPREAILYDTRSGNSWEEAVNTLSLMRNAEWGRVIVVSDPPHMRRLRWVWGRVFEGSGIDVRLVSSHPRWWDSKRWWRNDLAVKFLVSEYLKIAYYVLRYGWRGAAGG